MPKSLEYDGCKLIKKKQNWAIKLTKNLFIVAFVLGGIAFLLFNLGGILGFENFKIFSKTNFNFNEKTYYALSFGNFDNFEAAEKCAQGAIAVGAGGYVWKIDNSFNVLALVYENEADANKVLENINVQNFNVSVVKIKTNKIKINLENFTKEEKAFMNDAVNTFLNAISEVYEIAIKLDTKEITSTYAGNAINNLSSNMLSCLENLKSIKHESQVLLNTKNMLIKGNNSVRNVVDKILNETNVNYLVKYLQCQLTNVFYEYTLNF